MYEPVLTDEKLDLYNVYEVHENYRILAMAVFINWHSFCKEKTFLS